MATWSITVTGKGIRRDAVEKIVEALVKKWDEKVSVSVRDATPPESRADRFSAAQSLASDAKAQCEELRDELQEWHDGIPENLQDGNKAQEVQEAIDAIEEVINTLEEAEGADVTFPGMY